MSFPIFEQYPPPIPKEFFEYLNALNATMDMLTGFGGMGGLGGIRITTSRFLPTERREQFRFPRSKKARMRKKWRKNQKNWRTVDARGDIYFIDAKKDTSGISDFAYTPKTALMHPDGYEALKKTVGVIRNCELK